MLLIIELMMRMISKSRQSKIDDGTIIISGSRRRRPHYSTQRATELEREQRHCSGASAVVVTDSTRFNSTRLGSNSMPSLSSIRVKANTLAHTHTHIHSNCSPMQSECSLAALQPARLCRSIGIATADTHKHTDAHSSRLDLCARSSGAISGRLCIALRLSQHASSLEASRTTADLSAASSGARAAALAEAKVRVGNALSLSHSLSCTRQRAPRTTHKAQRELAEWPEELCAL